MVSIFMKHSNVKEGYKGIIGKQKPLTSYVESYIYFPPSIVD